MRKINRFISLLLILCMMPLMAFAEDTYTPEETEKSESVTVNNAIYDIDNSELDVRVVHNSKDGEKIIFTGKLKDYENGKWIHLDFSQVQFWAIFQWEGPSDESRYIIPIENEFENGNAIEPPEETDDLLSANSSVNAESSIKCDVNLMYDGAYSERVMIKNKQFNVPVKITNTAGNPKSVICFLAEYGEKGELLDSVSSSSFTVEAGKTVETNIIKTFSQQAKTARIFIWDNETMQPATGAITLDENESDYYADKLDDAGFYDINYQIKGKINTVNDVDYIKFIPETSGTYTIKCISTSNIHTSVYKENYGSIETNFINSRCAFDKERMYYMKTEGSTGEYILDIQYNAPAEADSFDVYEFDIDTNIYKKSIQNICNDLYSTNKELSKQMYSEYETILSDDAKLHRLPDFLADHPKNLSNFDTLLNQYYGTKYNEFNEVRRRYVALIDKYGEFWENDSTSDNQQVVSGNNIQYEEQAAQTTTTATTDAEIQSSAAIPKLKITKTTSTSIRLDAIFPISGKKWNAIYIVDFNERDGLTTEKKYIGDNIEDSDSMKSGSYIINNLKQGGIYIIELVWAGDGSNWGGRYSICRFVQLPDTSEEIYGQYEGYRVCAELEESDKTLASDEDFTNWLGNMDKVYNAYKDLTGYTPYNSKKIIMKSTRDNLNDYMGIQDGKNYWWVIFGHYGGGNVFRHSRAFYQGHMRRLKRGDWGDTPMHELSHVFDSDKWIFDAETLSQLKIYYAMELFNARVYRPDRFASTGGGWYTGTNYYTLLKKERFLDSYQASFARNRYSSEGFAAVLIELERKINGWEPFKKTFRYFGSLPDSQIPQADGDKLNLFLTKLKDYSGRDVLGFMSRSDKSIVEAHFGVKLEYTDPIYPDVSEDGGKYEIEAEKDDYAVYRFVPEISGNYYIYTSPYAGSGVSNDTYIEVYTNADLSGTPVASNDDFDGRRFSKVSIAATAGTEYYIKVSNCSGSRLHAQLNITKNNPVQTLTQDSYKDIITASGETAMFSFTPDGTDTYVFKAENYNGGSTEYDTYIKLYADEHMSQQIGNDEKKIVANLQAGHTYYLQFSGFLMSYARGRITVSLGRTIHFTKRNDSSFLYVNNPEYIANEDIIDDIGTQNYKLFEQKNVYGKNTYYQTHLAWYNSKKDASNYPKQDSFYVGIDFYNPNGYTINVDISNLVATENKTHLSEYVNKNGENPGVITIQPYTHTQLFDYTVNKFACHREGHTPSLFIMFDFDVKKATGAKILDGQGITVSTLTAYNYENMRLKDGSENSLIYNDISLKAGDMLHGSSIRPTEEDLAIKYKGIARNQSNQIDANLEFAIDDDTYGDIPFRIKDSGELINGYYPHEQTDWNVQINPINDDNEALIHTTTDNLHKFKYRFSDSKTWYFDYKHRKSNFLTEDGDGIDSINQEVPQSIINAARNDIMSGIKTAASRDGNAAEMGSWGVVYHYTVTVNNTGIKTRKIKHRVKTGAHYTLVGMRESNSAAYEFKDTKTENGYQIPFEVAVPPGQKTFEIVTLCGGGDGGLENTIIVE